MNVLMLDFIKQEEQVENSQGSRILYQAVNPGHCKTALNGFRGQRDSFEGVKVVQEMVVCEGSMRRASGSGMETRTTVCYRR
jgi:hypothetical protein